MFVKHEKWEGKTKGYTLNINDNNFTSIIGIYTNIIYFKPLVKALVPHSFHTLSDVRIKVYMLLFN
jgi:hypothetical protein